jgi:hypothetical protein
MVRSTEDGSLVLDVIPLPSVCLFVISQPWRVCWRGVVVVVGVKVPVGVVVFVGVVFVGVAVFVGVVFVGVAVFAVVAVFFFFFFFFFVVFVFVVIVFFSSFSFFSLPLSSLRKRLHIDWATHYPPPPIGLALPNCPNLHQTDLGGTWSRTRHNTIKPSARIKVGFV